MPTEDELLDAIRRKIEIARFHLVGLRDELASAIEAGEMMAPVPVQACLEGVVSSADSAAHKTAQLKQRLRAIRMPDGRSAYEHLAEWRNNPLVQHTRCIRNLALHSAYFKRPVDGTWRVPEIAETTYHGPHELQPYCEAIVDNLGSLGRVLASV